MAAAIDQADLILDGMLGIGGKGGLREPYATLAAAAAQSAATVVAVDLPSGVDADTGEVAGAAVRADVTVTFGTWKPGLLIDPGASYAGVTELIDIGLVPDPPDVVSAQAADIAALLPSPTADSDKYRRGVLGLVSGSERYTGAAVLSVGRRHPRRGRDDPVPVRPARGGRGPPVVAGDRDHPAAARASSSRRRRQPLAGHHGRGLPGFGRPGPGLGGRPGHGHRRRLGWSCWPRCSAPTCRPWSTRTA